MRTPVKCKNCGIKWLRATPDGEPMMMITDIQVNCPKCGSNWCEELSEEDLEKEGAKPCKET